VTLFNDRRRDDKPAQPRRLEHPQLTHLFCDDFASMRRLEKRAQLTDPSVHQNITAAASRGLLTDLELTEVLAHPLLREATSHLLGKGDEFVGKLRSRGLVMRYVFCFAALLVRDFEKRPETERSVIIDQHPQVNLEVLQKAARLKLRNNVEIGESLCSNRLYGFILRDVQRSEGQPDPN
jgi:hypothetical protein